MMNTINSPRLDAYLKEYSESHQNVTNIKIHNVCVPAIMWSVLGFLHTFSLFGAFTFAQLFIIGSLFFYASLKNSKIVISMALISLIMLISFNFVPNVRWTSLGIFIIAWIGQFYGHKIEGKKPSFFKDLLFLLIGPIWVFKKWFPSLIA
jgi:uncharacterized membrane protein YGL010W